MDLFKLIDINVYFWFICYCMRYGKRFSLFAFSRRATRGVVLKKLS